MRRLMLVLSGAAALACGACSSKPAAPPAPAPERPSEAATGSATGSGAAASPAPSSVEFEPGTPKFADVLAKARAANKPAFLDFSTEWCVWCRRLEQDTFSQPSVAQLMTAFVNVQIDAEKGEGPSIASRYGVVRFPTLVVVDAAGTEVGRVDGYKTPEQFTPEIRAILAGIGRRADSPK
jgi:thiol:disulfide interchange protein